MATQAKKTFSTIKLPQSIKAATSTPTITDLWVSTLRRSNTSKDMADANPDVVYYHYNPVLWATITSCALFAISSVLHTYQMIRARTMYMIPVVIGVIMEAVGYGARAPSAIEAPDFSLPPYIVQSILILIAPALFAASVYMILGYIILAVDGEHHSMIRKKFLTKIFVLGDICAFMIQSTGK
jgi:RTA1 like protein